MMAKALHSAAYVLLSQGQIEPACRTFCRLLDSCPDMLDDVAGAFGGDSERRDAIACLENRFQSHSTPTAAEHALASRLLRDVGRANAALEHARRAVAADPICPAWWFEFGDMCLALGDLPGAASAYSRCLKIAPRHMLARSRLALCRPRRWSWLARRLYRIPIVRRVLRRVVRSGGRTHLLETRGDSAAAHQMRWAQALEQGSALVLFPLPPKAVEPEAQQREGPKLVPPFWSWFLSLGIAGQIHSVLDVGCGTGFSTQHFLHHGYEVAGVTSNPHEKRESAQRGIRVVDADFHFLPIADARYDLVFSSHSLEHSISPLFALWEWKRVLRPGGYLLIVLPFPVEQDARTSSKHYDPAADAMCFARTDEQVHTLEDVRTDHSAFGMSGHIYVLNRRQLEHIFLRIGFEIVAEAAEDPISSQVLPVERGEEFRPRGAEHPFNGLFLLRKPAEGHAEGGG